MGEYAKTGPQRLAFWGLLLVTYLLAVPVVVQLTLAYADREAELFSTIPDKSSEYREYSESDAVSGARYIVSKRNLNAQEGIWLANSYLVMLTALQTLVGISTVILLAATFCTQRAELKEAKTTARAAQLAESPYLFIDVDTKLRPAEHGLLDNELFDVCIALANYGKAPAKVVNCRIKYISEFDGSDVTATTQTYYDISGVDPVNYGQIDWRETLVAGSGDRTTLQYIATLSTLWFSLKSIAPLIGRNPVDVTYGQGSMYSKFSAKVEVRIDYESVFGPDTIATEISFNAEMETNSVDMFLDPFPVGGPAYFDNLTDDDLSGGSLSLVDSISHRSRRL